MRLNSTGSPASSQDCEAAAGTELIIVLALGLLTMTVMQLPERVCFCLNYEQGVKVCQTKDSDNNNNNNNITLQ